MNEIGLRLSAFLKRFLAILFFTLSHLVINQAEASVVFGKISADAGESLPFASIMVAGSSHGTTANLNGQYSIELPPGRHVMVFSMIGYHQLSDTVLVSDNNIELNVILKEEAYLLNELKIIAGEDPAYEIIRNAQKRREVYRNEVEQYSCETYVKSTQRLTKFPKRFMGKDLELDEIVDTVTGIFYLSESVSKFAFKRSGKIKEEMISSKVSGNPRTYSFNSAADLILISLYNPLIKFTGLAPRGIISPIADNAFFYYRFILQGTFTESGKLINKIKVIPRRSNDPVFSGDIFIVDGTWRIHSADLTITKDQQLEFVDTFRIRQSNIDVGSEKWMPFNSTIYFHFNLFGFQGSGDILGVFKDYNLTPRFTNKDFGGEVLKVESYANKRDSFYWEKNRPVPLTHEEHTDYQQRDSITDVKTSKSYLDSVDHKNNQFKFGDLLSGYTHNNSFHNRFWTVTSPLQEFHFNTVEGFNLSSSVRYSRQFGDLDAREWTIETMFRYGLSNSHFCPSASFRYRYNPKRLSLFEITGGQSVNQFNGSNPISSTVNSIYSLLAKKNYMKIYQQDFVSLSHRSEIVNGFLLGMNLNYAKRYPLQNTSDYSFVKTTREYQINNPVVGKDTVNFNAHQTMAVTISTRIRIGQRYISRPEAKYPVGTPFPSFRFEYQLGVPVSADFTNYQFLRCNVEDELSFGIFGSFIYKVGVGNFISRKRVEFMDYKHFNGNLTWFSSFGIQDFPGLDYYNYSTTSSYLELHAEQHLHGFLLNKIPLLRKLKLDEVLSVHSLSVHEHAGVVQLAAGFEKLNLFRIQAFSVINNGKLSSPGIVFGLKAVIGRR